METKAETANDGWQVTAKRYVAFIDIMGFKDMVLKNTHEAIYQMMLRIDESKQFMQTMDWIEGVDNLIKSTTYSDSIIIYSKDDTFESLDSIISTASGISNDLFQYKIPHKGALSFGKLTLDFSKSIFFGQPLIDAYLVQEELFFYGLVVHGSAEMKILELDNLKKPLTYLTDYYPCPLKNGNSKHLTIYPLFADENASKNHTDRFKKVHNSLSHMRFHTSGHLRKYIDNTETYLEYVKTL